MALRPAVPTDLAQLIALEQASFAGDRIAAPSWRRLLRRPSVQVLVAENAAGIAGALVLLFRRRSRIARVYSIAVMERHRGTGLGRALIEQAQCCAAQRGCTRLRLETRLDNHPAQALFARLGFAVTAQAPDYYQDGMAALRLECRLLAA
jgi:[ribosomal protein S18]-alanine N-acetyltransferase